ncbi:MAG: hypothetical protein ACR2NN_15275 [Bryobacteraceae bacterium]
MGLVRLVCWKSDLAEQRARQLRAARFVVDATPLETGRIIGVFRANPPAAVVIDLDRLPSHGREVGVALRSSKSTRSIPIVFAGGAPDKVERIRKELPDAFFTDWAGIQLVLSKALMHVPADPIAPTPHMERYAGSSLVKKLGFAPDMKVALLGPPEDFEERLGELPAGVVLQTRITRQTQMALWFVRARAEIDEETPYISAKLPPGCSLWIIHSKQAGRYKVDFNQNDVRESGLQSGLVDFKVCAVDADWSGLKFARKKS